MLMVQQCHQAAERRIDPNNSPLAIRSMGTQHNGSIPISNATIEVPCSQYRLFH